MAFVIAAPASNNGKTLISLLLTSWVRRNEKNIQTFKAGPDYLDPQLLSAVSNRPCRNLDPILTGKDWVVNSFNSFGCSADFAFVEGVMGLYDGIGSSTKGSTAELAKLLDLQIVLVVNANSQAGSIAALIKGFRDFDNKIILSGVVLNKVNSQRHKELLTEALKNINVKVLGCLPKEECLSIPSKNLGLLPANQIEGLSNLISKWAKIADKCLDMDSFISLLKAPKRSETPGKLIFNQIDKITLKEGTKIAIAKDKAFHFRYSETNEYLEGLGIHLVDWSILKDQKIPKGSKGLIIPGGFPEEFAEEISQCKNSLNSIRESFGKLPIYAECGGMLILGNNLYDKNGNKHLMANLLPFNSKEGKLSVGYREIKALANGLLLKKGQVLMGHEFHRWKLDLHQTRNSNKIINQATQFKYLWEIKGWGLNNLKEGFGNNLLHASWIHLHWPSSPIIIYNFLNKIDSVVN